MHPGSDTLVAFSLFSVISGFLLGSHVYFWNVLQKALFLFASVSKRMSESSMTNLYSHEKLVLQ